MGFWVFMTVMALLIPGTMLLFGTRFERKPPRRNSVFGYKTAMSQRNDDTWAFAHRYIGRLWRVWGLATLCVSLLVMLLALNRGMATVGYAGLILIVAQLVPLVGAIFSTERALKRTFDRFGQRIQ